MRLVNDQTLEESAEIIATLRDAGLDYSQRRRLLSGKGRRMLSFPLTYLGADDSAGPNYTGQPAVNSHYRRNR